MKVLPRSRAGRSRLTLLTALFLVVVIIHLGIPACGVVLYQPREGDLIFQSLPRTPLVNTIEGSTGSPYSHCGIIVRKNGEWVVLEAIGPVRETSMFSWIRRGRRSFFEVYRLKPEFQQRIPEMVAAGRRFLGRPYDIRYRLDDEKIYCSELIWKAYREAGGGEMGSLTKFGDLGWQPYESVILQIEGRVPLERDMITPCALAGAPQLEKIFSFRPPGR